MENLRCVNFSDVDHVKEQLKLKSLDNTFFNILKYLKEYHNANSIIIEKKYIDKDYTNEFSSLYSKTFRLRHGYCERLHFFKNKFNSIENFIKQFEENDFDYLGYVVKRPLEVGKVGRTLILPKDFYNFNYLCLIEGEVHLMGKTLRPTGVPFLEQDAMVITCAQANIWIASTYMHHVHAHRRHFPFEITERAQSALNLGARALPSSGLNLEQMMAALNNMGYFPILYVKPDEKRDDEIEQWQPIEKINHYIESGIPVIICFEEHAATVIGHKIYDDIKEIDLNRYLSVLEQKQAKEQTDGDPNYLEPSILSNSIFIDSLILHDDQEGIYRLLPSHESSYSSIKRKYGSICKRRFKSIPKPLV